MGADLVLAVLVLFVVRLVAAFAPLVVAFAVVRFARRRQFGYHRRLFLGVVHVIPEQKTRADRGGEQRDGEHAGPGVIDGNGAAGCWLVQGIVFFLGLHAL